MNAIHCLNPQYKSTHLFQVGLVLIIMKYALVNVEASNPINGLYPLQSLHHSMQFPPERGFQARSTILELEEHLPYWAMSPFVMPRSSGNSLPVQGAHVPRFSSSAFYGSCMVQAFIPTWPHNRLSVTRDAVKIANVV